MPQFTYKGDGQRVYPDITVSGSVLVAEAGKSYDLAVAPDELWVSVSAPQAVSTPSVVEVDESSPSSEA